MKKRTNTWTALARSTGYSVEAFRTWRKLPGAPSTPDPKQWEPFIEDNGLGLGGNSVSAGRRELMVRKLEKEVRLLDIKIQNELAKVVSIDEVQVFVANLLKDVSRVVRTTYQEMVDVCQGVDIAEGQVRTEKLADECMVELQNAVSGWWPESS